MTSETIVLLNKRMHIESEDYRSLWELAHQWAGLEVNHESSEDLPLQVGLNLERLAAGILNNRLMAKTKRFHLNNISDSLLDSIVFSKHLYRLYQCREGNHRNQKYLQSVYVNRADFLKWCIEEQYPVSDFWVLTQVQANHKINNRPKNEIEDKAVCRGIAMAYWDIDPNIHPAHMASAKALKRYGNANQYDDKTIKGWISELDPQVKTRKTGRPTHIDYKIDLEKGTLYPENELSSVKK